MRAEPISALYEQSRVHHVGMFAELEDQQCDFVPGESESPDRMDALVWALTELSAGAGCTFGDWVIHEPERRAAAEAAQMAASAAIVPGTIFVNPVMRKAGDAVGSYRRRRRRRFQRRPRLRRR